MRQRTIAAATGATLALAAGATAIAAPGAGPAGPFAGGRDEHRDQHARALAGKLGVDENRVRRAMDELHSERHEAIEDELARALGQRLDVAPGEVERALEKVRPQRGEAMARHGRGEDRDAFAGNLAEALNKPADEVRDALRAVHQAKAEGHLRRAVENGQLTREQADRLKRQFESGRGRGGGHGPGPALGPPGGHGADGGPGGPSMGPPPGGAGIEP
jgi:hypothetical protein